LHLKSAYLIGTLYVSPFEVTGRSHTIWKAKYGGLEVGDAQRLKALEDENRRLKRLVADLALDNAALKDVLSKNW
jgi:putative transposase